MTDRVINIVFALDCFLFAVATLGKSFPFESFSSAAYRAELKGYWYRHMRPVIDTIMWFDKQHCRRAYLNIKLNLPEDQR